MRSSPAGGVRILVPGMAGVGCARTRKWAKRRAALDLGELGRTRCRRHARRNVDRPAGASTLALNRAVRGGLGGKPDKQASPKVPPAAWVVATMR